VNGGAIFLVSSDQQSCWHFCQQSFFNYQQIGYVEKKLIGYLENMSELDFSP